MDSNVNISEMNENLNTAESDVGSTPQDKLLESLLIRDIATFRELLKHPDVDPSHKYGRPHWSTCLEIASRLKNSTEFIKVLLQFGVKPNINTIVPEPIHYAASKGNDDTLRVLLLDKRTKVNAVDSFGRTALHCAAKNFGQNNEVERYERCIALLISRPDMDVNRPNKKGCTAIYEAAHFGGKDAVVAMLKHGSHILDLDSSRGVGKSARQVIIERYPDLRTILPPLKIEQLQSDPHTQLLAALQHHQLNVFRDLLCQVDIYGNAHLDPNFWYNKPHNSTCLQMACKEHGCEEFVQALLLAGADPNTVNIITKKSPLHIAVEAGNHETVQVLLEDKKTNVNMADENGKTPLHSVMEQHWGNDDEATRFEECLSLLLQHNDIDVNISDSHGNTPIRIAVLKSNTKALTIMLKCKGHELDLDSSQETDQKTTRKIITEKFSDIKKLLPQKSIVEDHENVKETLFQYLYKCQCNEFIEAFKNNVKKDTANSLQESNNGCFTLLQFACNYGLLDIVQVLLEHEANPNAITDFEKKPPIILACLKQNVDILKCFLELPNTSSFNINATDAKGNTALHYAARNGDLSCVISLLHHGADVKIRNIFDQPPLPAEVVQMLLNQSIKTNQHPEDDNYELIFDYSFLLAHNKQGNVQKRTRREDKMPLVRHQDEEAFEGKQNLETLTSEMDLVFHLSESQEHRHLLTHPIITSFLQLKWFRIRATYFTNLALYILFLLLLNIYILMDYGQNNVIETNISVNSSTDNSSHTSEDENHVSHLERFRTMYGNIIWYLLISILFCHTVREMFKFVMSPARYLSKLDNMLDMVLVFITAIVLFNTWEHEENKKLFTAFCLFLSWVELALIIGRLPIFSINIQMLKSVSKHYSFIFMSYFFIIIAFGVGFYIFYHDNWMSHQSRVLHCQENKTHILRFSSGSSESFQNPNVLSNNDENDKQTLWTSVTQAGLYVAGGFSATFIPIQQGYGFIMLLLFTFIVIMVMINILTAIAVADVTYIQDNAEQFSIISRITLLYEIESILIYWNTFMERICKFNCASKMSSYLKSTLRKVILFPDIKPMEKRVIILPNKSGKIVFPNESCTIACKINMRILKSAINIIGNTGKISDIEQIKQNLHTNHNEGLQKLTDCNHTLDRMQNKISTNNVKIEALEDDISKVQHKLDKNYKNLDASMKTLIEQCQLQMSRVQENLQQKLDNYENRFNWLEQSHKQTTDLLTEILSVLNNQYEDNIEDN